MKVDKKIIRKYLSFLFGYGLVFLFISGLVVGLVAGLVLDLACGLPISICFLFLFVGLIIGLIFWSVKDFSLAVPGGLFAGLVFGLVVVFTTQLIALLTSNPGFSMFDLIVSGILLLFIQAFGLVLFVWDQINQKGVKNE